MFDVVKFNANQLRYYVAVRSNFLKDHPGAECFWFNQSINHYLNELGGLAGAW